MSVYGFSFKNYKLFLLIFTPISLIITFYYGDSLIDKIDLLSNPTPGSGRYIANYISLREFFNDPFFGHGLASYDLVRRYPEYDGLTSPEIYDHGGSDFLQLLLDFGIFIFIFFILFFYIIFKKINNSLPLLIIFLAVSIRLPIITQ